MRSRPPAGGKMKNYGSTNGGDATPSTINRGAHPEDHLTPPFDSGERSSSLLVGTFNLIATVVGGGVLSLPIVFEKCGIAFTTLAMILSAFMTYMSLMMLCYCSRRGGGSSYGEVVRSAFGERAEEGVSWLLFVFLAFVIVGYMVLIRDIWTPLALQALSISVGVGGNRVLEDRVLLAIVVILLPFLLQRSLHALRYNCYVGSASIFVLCVALWCGGLSFGDGDDADPGDASTENYDEGGIIEIEFFKIPLLRDALFSFPIVTCAFLCHFNIIAIQNALTEPTRERMRNLTQYAMGACFFLMYMFGLGGYLYAGRNTEGNILLNVPMAKRLGKDKVYYLFLLGRIGCGTTIMFAMPMMVLPCREALLEVVDIWFHKSHHLTNEAIDVPAPEDEGSCWKMAHAFKPAETARNTHIATEDEVTENFPPERNAGGTPPSPVPRPSVLIRGGPIQGNYVFRNALVHCGSTLLIVAACYLGAVAVSGVAIVWSFIGSSMAFLIAFILPCGCFVVIEAGVPMAAEGGDRKNGWIRCSWAILVFSAIGAVVCTINNTVGFGR